MKNFLTLMMAALISANTAFAADTTDKSDFIQNQTSVNQKLQQNSELIKQTNFINQSTHNSINILSSFKSDIPGLTGFVITSKQVQGKPLVAYVNDSATYMVVGAVLNAQGVNITYQDTIKYITSAANQAAYKGLQNTYTFLDGDKNAPHKMTIIADPNCIFCHKLYQATRSYVKSGTLAINWMLVGFLKDTSQGKAAAIMNSKDPAQALAEDENNFDIQNESGAIQPLLTIPADIQAQLNANAKYFNEQQFSGTPVLIFTTDNQPEVINGYIEGSQLSDAISKMDSHF